jgi:hypothetical protein
MVIQNPCLNPIKSAFSIVVKLAELPPIALRSQ